MRDPARAERVLPSARWESSTAAGWPTADGFGAEHLTLTYVASCAVKMSLQSGGHTVHVLKRWYPTNPQGEYQAAFLDEQAGAILLWDINSLNKADFHTYSPQQAADDLMGLLRTE